MWVVSDQTKDYSETGTSFRQALYAMDCGFKLFDTMIWVKDGGGSCGSNMCYVQNTEYMFVFSKGRPNTVNLIKDHKNKHAGGYKIGHGRRTKSGEIKDENNKKRIYPEYSKRNNWWLMPRCHGYGNHPAAFPLQLATDHILSWSNEGDMILDPLMGSGTTGVACVNTNRNFIGIDISEEYVELARKRIEEAKEQSNGTR